MSDKGITLEGLAAAVDALREELATWKALARKQDTLTAAQITATQSGATAAKIDQIAVNTAAIQALSAQVAGQISLEYVTTLPATGEPFTLYLVPQGDGTAPNFCNEYLWINGGWELIGTTGSMANNGELTIQVNGVAVGTFTANQAANTAINVTVPTNTNQLINGAQYVDASALATALALKQNNLNASQLDAVNSGITAALVTQIGANTTAIAGKQDALSTAQQAAVDSGATAAKIDQIATNAAAIVALTSSKQDTLSTAQLAAVNSGITSAAVQQISTNTTDIASKAADNAVVHLAGAETIPGDKTFTGAVVTHDVTPETDNTYSLGSSTLAWSAIYANNVYANTSFGVRYASKTADSQPAISGYIQRSFGVISSDGKYFSRFKSEIAATYSKTQFETNLYDSNADELASFKIQHVAQYNSSTGVTSLYVRPSVSGVVDLGLVSNKWKSLNGINPGALSLPDASKAVTVDTTNYVWTGPDNLYVAPADGWVSLKTTAGSVGRLEGTTTGIGSIAERTTSNILVLVNIPVLKNESVIVSGVGSGFILKFYPCLGNV